MATKTTHYTNFGVSMQPEQADAEGFLTFRDDYESLPRYKWTAAEAWINEQEERIERAR